MNIRGLVYCVNDLFPWKMAPEGPGAVEKAGGVFRFPILSRPLLVDFMCLSILLKHQNPAMASTWSCQCLAGPLSQSCFQMLLFSWLGRRRGGRRDTPRVLRYRPLWCCKEATAGSTHRPSGWGGLAYTAPPCKQELEVTFALVFSN